jgi:hypothetical protein
MRVAFALALVVLLDVTVSALAADTSNRVGSGHWSCSARGQPRGSCQGDGIPEDYRSDRLEGWGHTVPVVRRYIH